MIATSVGATGKIIQVAGPAVDVQFPEGAIPSIHNALRITSEGFNVPDPVDIIVEVAQHIGEGRVRTIALQPTEGLVRGMKAEDLGHPVSVPVGPQTLGRVMNVIGEPVDKMGPVNYGTAIFDSSSRASVRGSVDRTADVRDRHQSYRSARTVPSRWKDRVVRRRWCRQDGRHHGVDQQHRSEAWRRFGIRGRR